TCVRLTCSQRSLSAQTKRSLVQTLTFDHTTAAVQSRSPLVETSAEIKHVAISPDGKLQALFRVIAAKEGGKSGGEKKVIEVVQVEDGRKIHEVEVTKKHGDWYFDPTFGPPAWHPDSSALVYTAEAPAPEPPSPTSARPFARKFDYTPDFGETFIGKKEPTLFLLVLPGEKKDGNGEDEDATGGEEATVHRLTDLGTYEKDAVFGQPAFLPSTGSGYHLVATAYSPTDDGRKLGIVYCQNRRARICVLRVELVAGETSAPENGEKKTEKTEEQEFKVVEVVPLSPADRSARSPRVVPASRGNDSQPRIVYVSNTLGGVHASCAQLQLATLSLSSSRKATIIPEYRTLVPVVKVPSASKQNGLTDFPGLYIDQLPVEPFVHVGGGGSGRQVKLALTSGWKSRRVPLLIDLESGEIENLAPLPATTSDKALPYLSMNKDELSSYSVLGTDGKSKILVTRSGPGTPPQVVVYDLDAREKGWSVLREPSFSRKLTRALEKIEFTLLPLPKHEPTELILVSPTPLSSSSDSTNSPPPPLIVQPHGGPHSQAVTEFSYSRAAAVLHGFRFVDVNYPGSTGFGQQTIDDLPPLLGTLEVEATLGAGRYLRGLGLASKERNKTLLMGGSHGGWTACHLTARWPDEYGAVVMRNPVTDLVANASATDIPDWVWEETALRYPLDRPPSLVSPEEYQRFYDLSPMRHAYQVTTPTLLLIGLEDRRVPPIQGRAWYHALKKEKEKVEVEMMTFPGNAHPIAETVEAEWVAWESGLRWLSKYTDFSA
ncbi:hypothetical protein JCM10908_006938, partial [Rhodotorula pacifica]|uniref:uncharacterized protein n=1 Tax=Rhodotorula pacifica TaxID=1495444 RepID=UPI00317870C9